LTNGKNVSVPDIDGEFRAVFDAAFYSSQLAVDVGGDLCEHYRSTGYRSGLDPSPYVSTVWLRSVQAEGSTDPLTTWLENWTENPVNPRPQLRLDRYLADNPDVAESGMNPLVHWLSFGRDEGRTLPGSDFVGIPPLVGQDHARFRVFASTPESRSKPRSALFVLGSTAPSGGNHVIFQHAHYLQTLGWEVTLLATRDGDSWGWHPLMGDLSFVVIEGVMNREFDVAIATTWTTVFNLPYVPARRWAYLVQSIESRFFDHPHDQVRASLAETTYALSIPTVTVASWLTVYLAHAYQSPSTTILNGIDKSLFNESGDRIEDRHPDGIRVLVEGSPNSSFKMVRETIEAARDIEGIELWHVGGDPSKPVPGVDRTFATVSHQEMPNIYRSCDLLLRLSRVEGCTLPPLEMFHCGGTAVTSDVTGHEEYMIDGHNCLVVDTNQPARARDSLTRLVHDRDLLAELKANAKRTAVQWPDWKTASTRFAAFLDTLIRTGPSPSSETVQVTRRLGTQLANTTEFDHA